ncbi:unnamed protein product [Cuscuta campestris]|uniref:Uncharacterized protein n=1 Tax=Cuscuta campestris TaxID=132261 RepID=A0A484N2P2_9ASTE|nr:unnamed protein product [Cuscuta campestris]
MVEGWLARRIEGSSASPQVVAWRLDGPLMCAMLHTSPSIQLMGFLVSPVEFEPVVPRRTPTARTSTSRFLILVHCSCTGGQHLC